MANARLRQGNCVPEILEENNLVVGGGC